LEPAYLEPTWVLPFASNPSGRTQGAAEGRRARGNRNRLRKWASVGEAQAAVAGTVDLDAEDEQWLREALRES